MIKNTGANAHHGEGTLSAESAVALLERGIRPAGSQHDPTADDLVTFTRDRRLLLKDLAGTSQDLNRYNTVQTLPLTAVGSLHLPADDHGIFSRYRGFVLKDLTETPQELNRCRVAGLGLPVLIPLFPFKGSVSQKLRPMLLYIIRKLFIKPLSAYHFHKVLIKGYAAIYV